MLAFVTPRPSPCIGGWCALCACGVSCVLSAGRRAHRQADKLVRLLPLHCSPLTNVYTIVIGMRIFEMLGGVATRWVCAIWACWAAPVVQLPGPEIDLDG